MNTRDEKLRDLLGYAILELDKIYPITEISDQIIWATELFEKRSIILCNPIGFQELHITVWWGYMLEYIPEDASCSQPLTILPKNKIYEACVGGYVERKDGLWIMGNKGIHLTDLYCSRKARKDLFEIPPYKSSKIKRTGLFHF